MLPDRLYRIKHAADLLALQPSTLYHLISIKAITVVRPTARSVRISEQEILRIQREGLCLRGEAGPVPPNTTPATGVAVAEGAP